MLLCLLATCKKAKKVEEDWSGTYTFKRHALSYWCDCYLHDSLVLLGPYTYEPQPIDFNPVTASITGSVSSGYSICLDSRSDCKNSLFVSKMNALGDSMDFGRDFCDKRPEYSILKMRGVKTNTSFKGIFMEFFNQTVPTTANPYDHVYIGTFELIKQ